MICLKISKWNAAKTFIALFQLHSSIYHTKTMITDLALEFLLINKQCAPSDKIYFLINNEMSRILSTLSLEAEMEIETPKPSLRKKPRSKQYTMRDIFGKQCTSPMLKQIAKTTKKEPLILQKPIITKVYTKPGKSFKMALTEGRQQHNILKNPDHPGPSKRSSYLGIKCSVKKKIPHISWKTMVPVPL